MNRLFTTVFLALMMSWTDMHPDDKPRSLGLNLSIGSLAGASEVVVNQPLVTLKNYAQQRINMQSSGVECTLPRSVGEFYEGWRVNAASMVPTTMIQLAVKKMIEPAAGPNVGAAMGGVIGAVVATPTEAIVLLQGNANKGKPTEGKASALEIVKSVKKSHGLTGLYRGLPTIMVRDGVFALATFALTPKLAQTLHGDGKPTAFETLAAGITLGVPTAAFTHPFDTIKTQQQNFSADNFLDACRQLYRAKKKMNDGTQQRLYSRAFFQGFIARGARVALATGIVCTAEEVFTKMLS